MGVDTRRRARLIFAGSFHANTFAVVDYLPQSGYISQAPIVLLIEI